MEGEGQGVVRRRSDRLGVRLPQLPRLRAAKLAVESECIGRAVPGKGCDWAAFGLFSGPLFVLRESGAEAAIFDFAGKPFTAE